VDEAVMTPAEQHQVVDARLASPRPMPNVVTIHEQMVLASREAAAAVTPSQRSS